MAMDVEVVSFRVSEMITLIEDNTRHIATLTRQKNKNSERVSAQLDFLRSTKRYLSEEQIEAYVGFAVVSNFGSGKLREILIQIHKRKDLENVKRQLLNSQTDFGLVLGDLLEIARYQREAIQCLEDIISSGESVVSLL